MAWKDLSHWIKGAILIIPCLIILFILIGILLLIINGGRCYTGICYAMFPAYCPKTISACFGSAVNIILTLPSIPLTLILDKDDFIGSFINFIYNLIGWYLFFVLVIYLYNKKQFNRNNSESL